MHVLHSLADEPLDACLRGDEFFWLALQEPTDDEIRAVGRRFGLHPLAVEDSIEFGQRPKLDDYGETALMVFYGVAEGGELVEVHLHLSGSWMVTIKHHEAETLAHAADRVQREHPRTEEEAIYRVLDALTDSFFPALERVDDQIDALMDQMMERPNQEQRQELFALRRHLVDLRRVAGPQRDMLARGSDLLGNLPGLEADDARD